MVQSLMECRVRTEARGGPNFPIRDPVLEVRGLKGICNTPPVRTAEPHEMVTVRTGALCGGAGGPEAKNVRAKNLLLPSEPTCTAV